MAYLAALEGALLLARAENGHEDSARRTRQVAGGVAQVAGTILDALLPGDA